MNSSSHSSSFANASSIEFSNSSQAPALISSTQPPYLFLFIQAFDQEGGIQSFIQDIFQSYVQFVDQPIADIFLLRDRQAGSHPFPSPLLRFHYFQSDFPQLDRLKLAVALGSYVLKHKPQRVFCGHINLAPLVRLICQPLGIPFTVMTHGKEVWQPLPPKFRRALQQANEIWTVSHYSRDRLCQSNHIPLEKVKFLFCATDGDRFQIAPKSATLVEKYDLAEATVLLTVARLWSGDIYKGVDVTIRALPAIAQAMPHVKYLVVGRGDDQPRLAQLAKDLGVSDRVIFAGFVPTDELPDYYRLADAYVMPSQEGFGIVYLEAMVCGIPVLSGDADGSADPLQNGQLGWRVPHRDPVAVTQACLEILQQQQAKRQGKPYDQRCNGDWLRQQAIELFGKAAFAQRLRNLLSIGSN